MIPDELAVVGPGGGVEQKLVGVKSVPLFRIIGLMDAVAITCASVHLLQIAVPDLVRIFGKFDTRSFRITIEDANLDLRRVC